MGQTDREGQKTTLSREVAAGWQQPRKVASFTTCTPHLHAHSEHFCHTGGRGGNPTQYEKRLEELARPVARTIRSFKRKSRSAKKKAPIKAAMGKLSAKRELTQTAELSESRELNQTEELFARQELTQTKELVLHKT